MRIMVERDTLAEAVAWVARSLPSRPVLPILSGLLLEADSGGLTLSCFDYEVSARIRVDAEVAEPGHGAGARAAARRDHPEPAAAGGRIRLRERMTSPLTCGPASFTLVTLPVKEYPRLPELPLLAGTVDGGVLATAIGQVVPAASRDDTLPVITGVNVEIDGRRHQARGDRQVPARHPGTRLESHPARDRGARCSSRPRRWPMPRG